MAVKEIVILDPHFRGLNQVFTPAMLGKMESYARIVWAKDEPMPEDELAKYRREAAAILSGYWRHGRPADYPKLKAFIELGGGLPRPKDFDYQTCFERGIHVLSCAPAFAPAVAEMALGLALAAGRGIVTGDRDFRRAAEVWETKGNEASFTLYGKPVGFIGFGSLARSLRGLLAPFRCRIMAYDPWQTFAHLRAQGVEPVSSLEGLLASSQVIFVLAIPTSENKGMLNRELLEKIKPGAVLVLVSRAHHVDFDALTEFVLEGKFRAAVDVFPEEPLPKDHRIRKAEGTILSAHKAGSIPEGLLNIGALVVDDLEAILAGSVPQHLQQARPELLKRLV